ncbi:MAG: hypothetical protein HY435_00915 [Candidatus Liptonbacteria bacterium]|nr:hypothetical protein [Candidatus Liptonbacteria bacterium]
MKEKFPEVSPQPTEEKRPKKKLSKLKKTLTAGALIGAGAVGGMLYEEGQKPSSPPRETQKIEEKEHKETKELTRDQVVELVAQDELKEYGPLEKRQGLEKISFVRLEENTLLMDDLDGDGRKDAAFITSENEGGSSGIFYDLKIALNRHGSPRKIGLALLGDRIKIEGIKVEGGEIVVNYLDHGEEDSMATASVPVERTFKVIDETLYERAEERQLAPHYKEIEGKIYRKVQ